MKRRGTIQSTVHRISTWGLTLAFLKTTWLKATPSELAFKEERVLGPVLQEDNWSTSYRTKSDTARTRADRSSWTLQEDEWSTSYRAKLHTARMRADHSSWTLLDNLECEFCPVWTDSTRALLGQRAYWKHGAVSLWKKTLGKKGYKLCIKPFPDTHDRQPRGENMTTWRKHTDWLTFLNTTQSSRSHLIVLDG